MHAPQEELRDDLHGRSYPARALIGAMAVVLLAGTILLGLGAAAHPMLPADPEAQLGVMAATPYWRAIHHFMIAGSGLVICGMWVRLYIDRSRLTGLLVLALTTIAVGLAFNAWNVEFMAGTGTIDAARFASGDMSVVPSFALRHTTALGAARLGNTLIVLGCLPLGWVEWRDPCRPVWIALLAWLASLCGIAGVTIFDPGSRGALAAVAFVSIWAAATAVLALRSPERARILAG
jgi:hypothetical protein